MQYAREHSFHLNEKHISDNIKYVRDCLVAASYEDKEIGIYRNFTYIKRIIKNSIELHNRRTLEGIKNDINSNKINKFKSTTKENKINKKVSSKER